MSLREAVGRLWLGEELTKHDRVNLTAALARLAAVADGTDDIVVIERARVQAREIKEAVVLIAEVLAEADAREAAK